MTVAGRLTISRKLLQIIRMIICVCRGLNTSKVNDAIAAGARSPAQVHRHHATTINCGKCCETVCGMIREAGANDGCAGDQPLMAAE
jgi:bacterioferritin-associated ferredoxin